MEITPRIREVLSQETPKALDNISTCVTGNVQLLCESARQAAAELGYRSVLLTTTLDCEAREAGRFFAAIARQMRAKGEPFALPCAVIAGGETVVHLKGTGKGGRNQELALSAAEGIAGLRDTVLFSFGSDGTDGPTDAAGGIVDGDFSAECAARGLSIEDALGNNDAYPLLKAMDSLIMSGPTGTNRQRPDGALDALRRGREALWRSRHFPSKERPPSSPAARAASAARSPRPITIWARRWSSGAAPRNRALPPPRRSAAKRAACISSAAT